MATLAPTSALTRVDLPTFGAPISAMKPQRVASGGMSSAIARRHPFTSQQRRRGRLFGRAFRSAGPFPRCAVGKFNRNPEFRVVVRTFTFDLTVGRRRQAARLGPFLQDGF